jgi:hypothetical protein
MQTMEHRITSNDRLAILKTRDAGIALIYCESKPAQRKEI